MENPVATLIAENGSIDRERLALVPTPASTPTHQVIPHVEVVRTLEEALAFRHIRVAAEEYAVSKDGMNFFGVMTLDQGMHGAQFALGVRNSHSKQFRLSVVVGLRIMVCFNLCFSGDFNIVLAKHSKSFNLTHAVSIGIDECQRGFEPMKKRVEAWQASTISDDQARLTIYRAFIEEELDCPKHLAREVHRHWFQPEHEEFQPRTRYSLNNAFTSAFQTLDPIPAYRATASLGKFFN